jgi:pyruvate kinase
MTGRECSIFIDLQGPIIRTKDFREGLINIPLKAGQEYRLTNNKKLRGNERFAVWDYSEKDSG